MKLTIERAALLKALGHVQSAVERRNTIPILSNVLLSAERDRLTFSATDLDLEIIDEALAQVELPDHLQAALLALTPDYRTAVVLSDVVGLNYQEIADALGASLGKVKTDIHRGREALKRLLPDRA